MTSCRVGAHHTSLDIADTEPSHHALSWIDESKTQCNPASSSQFLVALFNERDNWFVGGASEQRRRRLGGTGSLFALSYAVNRCNQNSVSATANRVVVTRLTLPRQNGLRTTISDVRFLSCLALFTATV